MGQTNAKLKERKQGEIWKAISKRKYLNKDNPDMETSIFFL